VRLKLVKELKSTVSESEFQHVVTRSLKKICTHTVSVLTLTPDGWLLCIDQWFQPGLRGT